jgi:hypothetical protein
LRLHQIRVRLLYVGRLLHVGQVLRIGGAVLRQRARQRRLLLVEVVLLLLAIDLNQRLSSDDAVAEVRQNPAYLAVGLRRDRHLIDRGERAHELHCAFDFFEPHGFERHRLGCRVTAARLRGFGFGAGRGR